MTLVRLCNKFSLYFRFREKFFLQVKGLPMGTVLSPFLANFYMDFIEQSALHSFPLKHSLWFRFVDDILAVWEHGQNSLKVFLAHLNSFDSNLQFTIELEDSGKLPFLDVLIIKNIPSLDFSIYRKPTHNDRYLHFSSNHPPCVKRGVVISLVDRFLKICSRNHVKSELDYVKDILFCNGYPINLIENIIDRRLKKIKQENRKPVPLDSGTLAIEKKTFTTLPYVSKLSDKLGKILKRHNLSVSFKTEQKVEHFFNSGKDKTDPILGSGVYRVPCSCGRFYIGRTNQQLGERLQEHKISIDKSLRLENKNDNFDSALAQHIYENPAHLVLFEEATLISTVNGLPQSFKEAIEIKKTYK
ncbi:uncharacterized protein LOC136035407 [Artemia franciscana]|uniref:uncharacterized protein LOC136035407 n=1 Tax=Artemia franciscana TaxID=6661 RepID=UPI0032D9EC32